VFLRPLRELNQDTSARHTDSAPALYTALEDYRSSCVLHGFFQTTTLPRQTCNTSGRFVLQTDDRWFRSDLEIVPVWPHGVFGTKHTALAKKRESLAVVRKTTQIHWSGEQWDERKKGSERLRRLCSTTAIWRQCVSALNRRSKAFKASQRGLRRWLVSRRSACEVGVGLRVRDGVGWTLDRGEVDAVSQPPIT
jgi:hypothetical protein